MDHTKLEAWKEAVELSVNVYGLTKGFPKEELYALTSQLRRAAVSIPSNIAEGCARNTNGESIHFLYIALGSLAELETQLIIAMKLGYIEKPNDIFNKITKAVNNRDDQVSQNV